MKRTFKKIFLLTAILAFIVSSTHAQELRNTGMGSTYASDDVGQPTASGDLYNSTLYTACHETLPFGTVVRVTNLRTNQSVLVTINDRFDYKTNRIIDLSHIAAKEIGLFDNIAPIVSIEVISTPTEETNAPSPTDEG